MAKLKFKSGEHEIPAWANYNAGRKQGKKEGFTRSA